MAPHVGFDTDQIKDKARKDLLYLLEGVSKGSHSPLICARQQLTGLRTGSRKEELGT
jgi:hypothetical protein